MSAEAPHSVYLHTQLQDEYVPEQARPRGVRLWSGAELTAQTWFVAEKTIFAEAKYRSSSYITADLLLAKRFLRNTAHESWGRIYIRLRGPIGEGPSLVLEELAAAYKVRGTGAFIYCLTNGLTVMDFSDPSLQAHSQEPLKVTQLYSNRRF